MSRKSEHPTLAQAAKSQPVKRPKSDVYKVADTMPATLRAELAEAIADRSVPAKALAKVLTERGYPLGYSSVQHFRNQGYTL